MNRHEITNRYFDYLYDTVCKQDIYRKLLLHLHDIEFVYSIARDESSAEHGKSLRYRFALTHDCGVPLDTILDYLEGPCSVLEMMVALAIYCEESIMDNPNIGDRTGQWFWGMMVNLGLGAMTNERFNRELVDDKIDIFLKREYEPDGRGGLFRIKKCDRDLRNVEIFHQLCWYLNSIM